MGEALRKPRYSGKLGSRELLPGGDIGKANRAKQIALTGHAEVTDEEARDWRREQTKTRGRFIRRENGGTWYEYGEHGNEKWIPD